VALAVQGVVYRLTGWVKKDLFWHNFDDDLWHSFSELLWGVFVIFVVDDVAGHLYFTGG
jgi:hypothetical protein